MEKLISIVICVSFLYFVIIRSLVIRIKGIPYTIYHLESTVFGFIIVIVEKISDKTRYLFKK